MAVRVTPEELGTEPLSLGQALRRRFGSSLLHATLRKPEEATDLPEVLEMTLQRASESRRAFLVARSARPIEEHLQLSLLSRGHPVTPR
jgi:phage gp36-like protein